MKVALNIILGNMRISVMPFETIVVRVLRHEKRMRRVLEIAWRKGNEVVILGAFGCGAFRNPPAVVAQAMKTAVQEYRKNFETIEFAVYCGTQYDTNYRVFQQILSSL